MKISIPCPFPASGSVLQALPLGISTARFHLATINYLLCTACCVLLFSCYTPRYVYSPAAHNVPLLVQKGDSKIGINYSSNLSSKRTSGEQVYLSRSNGMDAQAAYAVSNRFALQLNYFYRKEQNGGNYTSYRDSAVIQYKRKLTELGAGYFTKLHPEGNLIFQVFAGIGFGNFSFTDNGKDGNRLDYSRYHKAGIIKYYVQPALMYQYKKQVAASLSSRFSIINFRDIKTDYTQAEQRNFELDSIARSPVVFWEPAFVNTIGFKKLPGLRLEYQFGMSILMSRRFIDARSFNFSVGIQADLPALLKKNRVQSKKIS